MSNVNPPFQNLSVDPAEMIARKRGIRSRMSNASEYRATGSGSRNTSPGEFCGPQRLASDDANKLCERAIHGLTALDYRQDGEGAD